MRNKIICAVFALFIISFAAASIIVPDKAFSENENRYLQTAPSFSFSALLDGSFTEKFENYVADQFVLRDSWIGIKTQSELAMLKKDSNGVYITDDGYIMEMFTSYDAERVDKNISYIKSFTDGMDIPVNVMLVPSASYILADKLPESTGEIDQSALTRYISDAGISVINVIDDLSAHAGEYIYYRTDHHYTSTGAYYCYLSYANTVGFTPTPISSLVHETLSTDFYGTTYSKCGYFFAQPDTLDAYYLSVSLSVDYNLGDYVTDSLYERKFLTTKDKYRVYLNDNQSVTKITRNGGNDRKLLIIKDSYANTFAQFAAADFSQVHLIDLRYYKASVSDYAEQNGITDILILYSMKNFCEDKNLIGLK